MNNKNVIIGTSAIALLAIIFFFFFWPGVHLQNTSDVSNETPVVSNDPYQLLKDSNADFRNGSELGRQKNYPEALDSFEKALLITTNTRERSIIDFAIADTKFNIVRNDGIEHFSAVANNASYPERTRALAMLRAFLLYFKYEDQNLLRQLSLNFGIPWTIPEQVTYEYMKKVTDLYPFALARIWMIEYELNQVAEGPVAKQLYGVYKQRIIEDIDYLKLSQGERMELTSSMGAHARLLSRLVLEYDAAPVADVEAAFQSLIDYGNANGLTTNKQYTLLYYANFLAGISEFEKAESMIELILKEGLDPAVREGLTRIDAQVRLPSLLLLPANSSNSEVANFISTIGSSL
jgi:hypothetical protein